jgi:peptidoglycan/LPS O-acetylase OafA/YrhL
MIIVLAQKALTFQDILNKLAPRGGIEFLYDIFLYLMFFLAVITMFMQSDKQMFPTILMAAVAAMAVIAKLNVLKPKEFGSLIINIGMGVLPLIVAGITQAKKSQGPAIIGGLIGCVYFMLFWLISQRG